MTDYARFRINPSGHLVTDTSVPVEHEPDLPTETDLADGGYDRERWRELLRRPFEENTRRWREERNAS